MVLPDGPQISLENSPRMEVNVSVPHARHDGSQQRAYIIGCTLDDGPYHMLILLEGP